MRKRAINSLAIVVFALVSIVFFGVGTRAASAYSVHEHIHEVDLSKCFSKFDGYQDIDKLTKPSDVLTGDMMVAVASTERTTLMPCSELLNTYFSFDRFNTNGGIAGDTNSRANFLKYLNYKVDNSVSKTTKRCGTYTIKSASSDTATESTPVDSEAIDKINAGVSEQIIEVCATIKNSKIDSWVATEIKGFTTSLDGVDRDSSANRGIKIDSCLNNKIGITAPGAGVGCDAATASYDPNNVDSLFTSIDNELKRTLDAVDEETGIYYGNFAYTEEAGAGMGDSNDEEYDSYYKKNDVFISNYPPVFTTDEKRTLLIEYYKAFIESSACNWAGQTQDGRKSMIIHTNSTDYHVIIKDSAPDRLFLINGTSWWLDGDWEDFKKQVEELNLDLGSCDNVEPPDMGEGTLTQYALEDPDCGLELKPCFNGASALGWIMCTVSKTMYCAMTMLYDKVVAPFLQVNTGIFSGDNKVLEGWQVFQGFANLVFVALLLVVIFSQVTGVGIDNLGIKRILPKLIVAAVLINLSYIICQLLVDVSNIAGYGLRELFTGIGTPVELKAGESMMTQTINTAVEGMMAGVALGTSSMWAPAMILPFLLMLVILVIGTFFVFLLLGVRQAGVVILVVVSPLAFVLYMLPNTKSLFQRWWKAFVGLLLLFPLCGALIGGSDLASRIIQSTADDSNKFWMGLIAALLMVVPFFFIPTLLKGSFSALGNLGAKISGVGTKIGKTVGGITKAGVERTGAFRNIQANAQERQDIRNRVAERKRLEGTTKRIGSIAESMRTPEQRMQYARAQAALEKMNDEDDFNSRPDLIVSEAAAKRFNRQVEAVKSRNVASGAVNVTGDVKGFNGKGSSFASGSLAHILYNTQDEAERYATVSQLMASGHHGAEALHQVMEALGNDGNQAALSSIAKAAKGDNKLGDLKSGSRSTYDYINDLAAGQVQAGAVGSGNNISDYAGKVKFGGMSEQQLINTDKEELQRYAQVINQKRASGESLTSEEQKLVQQATAAWDNERIRGSAKKDVQNLVSEIAFGAVNIGNNKARPGTSFDVQHNNGNSKSTPAPRTSADRVNAATDRLEEIARQRNNGGGA